MRLLLTVALFIVTLFLTAQEPALVWAKNIGGISSSVGGYSIAVDASGNVYTAGGFIGTVDFDPGPGTFNLTALDNDLFISKLDAAGNFVWAKRIGGNENNFVTSIAIDLAGNVFTTGAFSGTVDFDPGPVTFFLTAPLQSVFVSKIDATGNFVWAKSMGETDGQAVGHSIAVDATGNVYTTGGFGGIVDFDPGPRIFNLTGTLFIFKLDAAGNFVWAKSIGDTSSSVVGHSIVVDATGNVYTTGQFSDTVDFDPGPSSYELIASDKGDIFISKLDATGVFVWANQIDGPFQQVGRTVTVDATGNILITGSFGVSKLDAAGNFVWKKNVVGITSNSIAVDSSGNVYTTGYFNNTVDFDPGPGTFNLTSAGGSDIFISKLDAAGNFVWARGVGGAESYSIAVDAAGSVYTTGYFSYTADFDPGPGIYNLTSFGNSDMFVLKLAQSPGVNTTPRFTVLPQNNTITLIAGQSVNVAIEATDPEANQIVTTTLNTNGVCGISAATTNGAASTTTLSVTGMACNLGTNTITLIATDNGSPNLSTPVNLTVIVNPPPFGGAACPGDTIITLSSCTSTTAVVWPVPRDTFPANIRIQPGIIPFVNTFIPGEGNLYYLGTFNGHGYYRSIDAYAWEEANRTAIHIGGYLATLTSAAENAFIVSKVNAPGFGSFSWIGLRSSTTASGNFNWVTGETLTYTNWDFNEPNNFGGSASNVAEPYVHIYEGDGQWHDLSYLPLPFLAEFNAPLIRWRQISGSANGSNLGVGVYNVCYERTNLVTNQRDSCCFTVTVRCGVTPALTTANSKVVQEEMSGFKVMANPNPSLNSFMLRVTSDDSKERISFTVMDIAGRIIETKTGIAPNQILQIGDHYRPGTYFIQVMQGSRTKVLKLIKKSK